MFLNYFPITYIVIRDVGYVVRSTWFHWEETRYSYRRCGKKEFSIYSYYGSKQTLVYKSDRQHWDATAASLLLQYSIAAYQFVHQSTWYTLSTV